jgi:t-SNARE complex subunit (syntaxin)
LDLASLKSQQAIEKQSPRQKADNMDKSQATSQQEVNHGFAQPKKTFGSRLKRSCARFWWLYLLAFAIIVLVIVLPMYDYSFSKIN